jgi:hypothetical protein
VRTLTEAQAKQLETTINQAATELREHAANHLYRADAHRAIKDKTLAAYHTKHAELVHELAAELRRQLTALQASQQPRSSTTRTKRPAVIKTAA